MEERKKTVWAKAMKVATTAVNGKAWDAETAVAWGRKVQQALDKGIEHAEALVEAWTWK